MRYKCVDSTKMLLVGCGVVSAFCVSLRCNMGQFQVIVRNMENKAYWVQVEASDTIEDLKNKLEQKTGTYCLYRSAASCAKRVC